MLYLSCVSTQTFYQSLNEFDKNILFIILLISIKLYPEKECGKTCNYQTVDYNKDPQSNMGQTRIILGLFEKLAKVRNR